MSITLSPYQKEINIFRSKSEGNYIFACQAAVPLVLTPDLLYQLWNNFKQYQYSFNATTIYKISHLAISDLLMSGLCREVGFELYEIEKNIRDILLTDLVSNLGVKRKNTIAVFLRDYAQLEYRFGHRKNLKEIHLLTATSILDPSEMEKQIIERINQTDKDAEKINLLLLHQNLLPTEFKSDLSVISRNIASKSLSPVLIEENDPNAPGVLKVKLPASLRKNVIERKDPGVPYVEELLHGLEAVAMVEDCLLQRSPILDLGNCGLTDEDFLEGSELDEILRKCVHLETLTLNNEPVRDGLPASNVTSNKNNKNRLTVPPPFISSLVNLSVLLCNGDADNPWGITDMSFLSQLFKLTTLDLSYNEIDEIKGLEYLHLLRILELNNNRISEIKGLDQLQELNALGLENNQLTEIKGLNSLFNLRRLFLSGNRINVIKGVEELNLLEYLEIKNNEISETPGLYELYSLKSLIISNNKISLFPLNRLEKLEYLDASHNSIKEIRGYISVQKLKYLELSFNLFSVIDPGFYNDMPALRTLNLSNNSITDIRNAVSFIDSGEKPANFVTAFSNPAPDYLEINIKDNPLVTPPVEIIQQGPEAILNYLREVVRENADTENKEPVYNQDKKDGWLRIKVIEAGRTKDGSIILTYNAHSTIQQDTDTKEEQESYYSTTLNRELIEPFLDILKWNAETGRTLFQLLLPNELKRKIAEYDHIIWWVNNETAIYPWEKLQFPEKDSSPIAINKSVLREFDVKRSAIILPNTSNHAFIVADPQPDGLIQSILGAREEANYVNDLLKMNGYETTLSVQGQARDIIKDLFSADYRILHLATYNLHDPNHDMPSGIVLGKDVYLTARDIVQMRVMPEFVFCNCDYIGRSDMARQLLEYGAKAVIVASDSIDDMTAMEFSKAFYNCMFTGNNFATSVLEARRVVYSRYGNTTTWGAYHCYGDPSYKFSTVKQAQSFEENSYVNAAWRETSDKRKMPIVRITLSEMMMGGFLIKGSSLHASLPDEWMLLTCFPVNKNENSLKDLEHAVMNLENDENTYSPGKVIWSSAELDTILLQFDKRTVETVGRLLADTSSYPFATRPPSTEKPSEVVIFGHLGTGELSLSLEITTGDYSYPYIFYTEKAGYHNPGNPVFNFNWELAGIHCHQLPIEYSAKRPILSGNAVWIGDIIQQLQRDLDKKPIKETIRIFLSSSVQLMEEREIIEKLVRKKNEELKDRKYFFELIRWGEELYETTYAQQLKYEIQKADIFVLIIDKTIGPYVQEEFDMAYQQFKNTGKPLISTYFKSSAEKQTIKLHADFKSSIALSGHIYTDYREPKNMESHFSLQLERIIRLGRNPSKEKYPELDNVVQDLIKEYNHLRISMHSGNERTGLMETIIRKMNDNTLTIGEYVPDLITGESGGERLAAVAFLKRFPDFRYMDWLSERIGGNEQPFIGYQAAWALNVIVKRFCFKHKKIIEPALTKALERVYTAKRRDEGQIIVLEDTKHEFDTALALMARIIAGISNNAGKRKSYS